MFSSMTIKQQFLLFIVFVCGIQLVVAVITFSHVASIKEQINGVAHRNIPVMTALNNATEQQLEQQVAYNKAFHYALAIDSVPGAKQDYFNEKKQIEKLKNSINNEWLTIEEMFFTSILGKTEKEIAAFNVTNSKLYVVVTQYNIWTKHVAEVLSALEGKHFNEAKILHISVAQEAEEISALVDSLLIDVESFTEGAVIDVEHQAQFLEWIVIIASLSSVTVAVIMSQWISIGIHKGLNKISASLVIQANGDFSRVCIIDEPGIVGELQRNMEGTRKSTNTLLAKVAKEVIQAVNALNTSTRAVKKNAEVQRSEIMHIETAFDEISSTAQDISSSTLKTQNSIEKSSIQSAESIRVNKETVLQTQLLIESLSLSSAALMELEKNSSNITSVLDVIKSIAEQTNLLALNAAIEAARAGDQGRGFAVVADEVRSLAQRTQDSTSEIESMIAQLSSMTKNAVDSMHKSCEMSDKTISLSRKSSHYLSQANENTSQVTDMNRQVASAAEQQNCVILEVNVNVHKISEMAQKSEHQVANLVDSTEKLNHIAHNLQTSVG